MSKAVPWSIKGVDFDVREAAKDAARRDGVTLGEWMNRALAERAAEIGVSAQEFDADERLEAVAAQLARLSRDSETETAPQRNAEGARRPAQREAARSDRHSAAAARLDDADWDDEQQPLPAPRRRSAPRDFFARSEIADSRRPRLARDRAESPLEQADDGFEDKAGRADARTVRAAPRREERVEEVADRRLHERLDQRLAEIELRLRRDEKEAIKPLHGMIASVQDHLGEIDSRLSKRDRLADDRPLRGALERLEARIEAMSREAMSREAMSRDDRSEANQAARDDAPLRQLDARLGAILSRLEKVEASPPGAARDEQFARLEKRLDGLMARLERPAAVAPQRRVLSDAVAEISARQRELDSASARPARPPAPQLTALLDERFETLARKFDLAAAKTQASARTPAAEARIDLLQDGIQALSGRIEEMRKDFAAAGTNSRAAMEAVARDLSSRVEAALATPPSNVSGLADLRRDISALSRSLGDVAPRAAVSGLENAMRDLANRVDAAREAALRAGAERREPTPAAELEALGRQVAERIEAALAAPHAAGVADLAELRRDIASLSAGLGDVAPRAAVSGLENAMRDLANRVDAAREAAMRAGAERREPTPAAELEALGRQVAERIEAALAAPYAAGVADLAELRRDIASLSAGLGAGAPRAAVAAMETSLRALADRVEHALDAIERAARAASEPTSSAEIEALGRQVAAMGRTLTELAPRSQVTSLENAVRALTARIERSRDDGMREAVLAPIESLADDVRRALVDAGNSANFDGVSRQLHEVESKIEQLRQTGGSDRADFLQVYDQSEQIRAMLAEAMQKMAPIERLEDQVFQLGARLDEFARQTREANAAQIALPWSEIDARLNDLASRLDRAPPPAAADDARFDDISRRIEFFHNALVSRIENAQDELRAQSTAQTLEPLLRSLSDRLSAEPLPQVGAEAIESLERRLAEISTRLELGDTDAERRLQRAIDQITQHLDVARDPERDDRNAREIADLREKTESSDRRAQQTLSAVHETLEKVVDRLAMIEEDVIEARGAAEAAARAPEPVMPNVRSLSALDVDSEDFLMEPGAGRPDERREYPRHDRRRQDGGRREVAQADPDDADPDDADLDDLDLDSAVAHAAGRTGGADQRDAKPAQSTYIDVARRALAARLAAEAAEKSDSLSAAPRVDAAEPVGQKARFVRPMSAGQKGGGRRMPILLFTAVSALSIGAYQAYRLFDAPQPPMQSLPEPHAEKAPNAATASQAEAPAQPAASAPAAPASSPAPAGPASPAAVPGPSSSAAPAATISAAPIMPSAITAAKPARVAGLPDPLATATIGQRPNTLSSIQAGAQAMGVKALAERGDAAAQYDYGARLAEGRGVSQDPAAAIIWFEKASALGLPQAQYRLGAIYEKGLGAPRDPVRARDNYQKAAEQGHVRAMHNLAVILAEGVEGKPDYAAAAQWFRRAAEFGVRDSQFNLAILYARGMGVDRDLGQSYVWFSAAAQQGDGDAAKKRDEIGAQLDAGALAAAKKQVAEFHAKSPLAAVNDPPALAPGAGASAGAVSAAVGRALSKI